MEDFTTDKFRSALKKLRIKGEIACACSGGIDSLAMTIMAAKETKIVALIVDHGLRKESKAEAKRTSALLTKLKIKNKILTHKGKKPESNLQEEARKIRYKLLTDYCKKNDIKYLATAHQAEDKAETFLLRLSRGSGVDGLSGIADISKINGVNLIRPMLGFSRKELQQFLTANRIKWVEDPTNLKTKYKRNKLRLALSELEDGELITKRINEAADNLARVRNFLEEQTAKAEKICINKNEIIISEFKKLHDEIAYRVLVNIIMKLSSAEQKPRFEKLKRLKDDILVGKTRTLSGLIFKQKKDKIIIDIEK